jgi:hypothetical protein
MKPRVEDDDLRAEYDFDFSKGERGRYYTRLLKEGSNIVVLEPDIAEVFPDSAACQITCPDGSSCSIGFGTCQCFNDGHAYCFPGELNFASMTQPGSRSLSTPAAATEISSPAASPSAFVGAGALLVFEGISDLLIPAPSPARRQLAWRRTVDPLGSVIEQNDVIGSPLPRRGKGM